MSSDSNTAPQRITRNLVLERLRREGGQGARSARKKRPSTPSVPRVLDSYNFGASSEPDGTRLADLQDWLQKLAEEEESKIDRGIEFGPHQLGSIHDARGGELLDHVDPGVLVDIWSSGLGMNTDVLIPIKQGLGPRLSKIKDLIAPFRRKTRECTAGSEHSSTGETYEDLLKILVEWNEYAYNGDSIEQREELLLALRERMHIIPVACGGQQKQDELTRNSKRLVQAIHGYRPETKEFSHQTPYHLMTVMVANVRIAEPDVDHNLKELLIRTMLAEVQLNDKEMARQRDYARNQLDSARRMKNREELVRSEGEKHKLNLKHFEKGAKQVINDLQNARKMLRLTVLENVQELTVAQAGQKYFVASTLAPTHELLEKVCDEADAKLERAIRTQMDMSTAAQIAEETNIKVMRELSDDSWRRVRKFAAADIDDPVAREATFKERLDNPETAVMMLKVKEDNDRVRETSQLVVERLSVLDLSLNEIYKAAKDQMMAYEEVYSQVEAGKDTCKLRGDFPSIWD